jgi:glycogen synthase kinase 3 beta
MNPNYKEYRFPQIKPLPWEKVFRSRTPKDSIDFVSKLLQYDPKARPIPIQSLADPYFNELRDQTTRLPSGGPLPDQLFIFTQEELALISKETYDQIVPPWIKPRQK